MAPLTQAITALLIIYTVDLAPSASAELSQRPDGTYTDECGESDLELNLDDSHVSRGGATREQLGRRAAGDRVRSLPRRPLCPYG